MARQPVSRQEEEVLMYVARHGPLSASAAWEGFGAPRRLARTSVLTVLERLRRKGHLGRRREGGVFVYRALEPGAEVLTGSVGRFVEGALGGSLAPFAAYLAGRTEVNEEELKELKRAVAALGTRARSRP